jgi:hypothetical protein
LAKIDPQLSSTTAQLDYDERSRRGEIAFGTSSFSDFIAIAAAAARMEAAAVRLRAGFVDISDDEES